MKHLIAGVVVLYNSPDSCQANIDSYLYQIDKLYVVLNGINSSETLVANLKANPKVKILYSLQNKGIAWALNQGAQNAIKDNYKWLLTMDDDTSLGSGSVLELYNYAKNHPQTHRIGIVASKHNGKRIYINGSILFTMTSGNLLNLDIYKAVGAFCELLFIDHVDHEYCLRLNSHGYLICETDVLIVHSLGEIKNLNYTNMKIVYHTGPRTYYIIRNGIVVSLKYARIYPIFVFITFKIISKEIIKSISLNKFGNGVLTYIYLGLIHGLSKKLGPINF